MDHTMVVGDELSADTAHRLARNGVTLLWRGDFRGARQLLDALKRRLDRRPFRQGTDPADTFRRYRQARAHRARVLAALVVELGPDQRVDLPHAPDVREPCVQAFGPADAPALISVQELLGVIGAAQWRRRGVDIPALGARIHPHYGVFAPTRADYVDLVAQAPLPDVSRAFDIGTGTGVLAALLARRGVRDVVATDISERAVACARDNVQRLGMGTAITVVHADLFPPGRADLVVCNPPWLPATPTSALEAGIYDRRSRMLTGFLRGLPDHLSDGGEAWLVLSDLAELLGLRTRDWLDDTIAEAGLTVRGRLDTRACHDRALDDTDLLAAYRAAETVSLWRLGVSR
jgi:SAM-dependent methyltransferase